jgi:hypothetical protein
MVSIEINFTNEGAHKWMISNLVRKQINFKRRNDNYFREEIIIRKRHFINGQTVILEFFIA